jgi:hypothetical protein
MILDLRGTAATDPIHATQTVMNLSELLASLQQERDRIADRVESARDEIKALVLQRSSALLHAEKERRIVGPRLVMNLGFT